MNKFIKYLAPAATLLLSWGLQSCVNDLHVEPIDPSQKTNIEAYQLFNKCYSAFATSGNNGGDDNVDIDDIDGGTSSLFRQMWNSNELTTDEAICGWGDPGIPQFCYNTYDASHPMLKGYYYRLCASIAYCNLYLKDFLDKDATMSAEVRFLRALEYYLLSDAFGNVPFSTVISADKPQQSNRADVMKFVESELLAIVGENPDDNQYVLNEPSPKANGDEGYGRVDKAAGWMLLSRLYLNWKVYTGEERWQDAKDYAEKVINSAYKLHTEGSSKQVNGETWEFTAYQTLFMGDNDHNGSSEEAIFPVLQDGMRTTAWGVGQYLIASTADAGLHSCRYLPDAVNGLSGQAWGGNRARPELVKRFINSNDIPEMACYDMPMLANDDRALFDSKGRTLDNEDVGLFTNGFAIGKFNNFTTDGSATSDGSGTFTDMDVYFMRVAEAYLNYAEAEIRLHGVTQDAVDKVNALRNRAHAKRFNTSTLTLDEILDEWSREFYFEGRRRVDLIRFGKFGGDNGYNWTWKGGRKNGTNFSADRNVFAIPSDDLIANKNLQQNPGY